MRVLLSVAWYFPDSVGGTEVYVRGLARHLSNAGVHVTIAVPCADDLLPRVSEIDGVPVRRFVAGAAEARLDLAAEAPAAWLALLDAITPDVVDLHSLTGHLGVAHLRTARRRGLRTVTTLHLPELTCARGTFMRFGRIPCDGDLLVRPCTACRLQAQGVPVFVGRALSHVPRSIGRRSGPLPRPLRRALSAHLAHETRRQYVAAVAAESDRLVALSAWQAEVLGRNGIPREKIRVCRQGVGTPPAIRPVPSTRRPGLRVGFVGRYHPTKGLHVLVDAVGRLPPDVQVDLHVWGVAGTPEAIAYRESIRRRAAGLSRFVEHPESTPDAIYRDLDALVVPSIYFETGPLVVLEAQAWGVPVLGSNLGGIAERITHGVDGLLVAPDDADALAEVLTEWARDPARLHALRPTHTVRTMADAAADTVRTYRELIGVPA